MSAWTPNTEQIRMAWILKQWESKGQFRSEGSDDEFDRWLAAHDQEVKADAWDEVCKAMAWAIANGPDPLRYVAEHNPYRRSE